MQPIAFAALGLFLGAGAIFIVFAIFAVIRFTAVVLFVPKL